MTGIQRLCRRPILRQFRSRRSALLYACALLCLILLCNYGQARQGQDDEVLRVDSELVLLNATVTDKEGRYVHKIPRADFKVLEDGHEQPINIFSVEETPFAAAILLDTSGSMEGRLSLGRAAAIRFLEGLRPDDVAAVYHFDTQVERLQDFSPGRDLPPLAFGLRAKGNTVLNDAILRAARDLSARQEKRLAIIVLSDGADTHSSASADTALNAALSANATIYTVDMMSAQADARDKMVAAAALKNFAAKSGGRYVPTPGGKALDEALSNIVEELSNQYTLGYRPTNRTRDGRWRAIELKLARPELKGRTRSGYRARKS